MFLLIAFLYGFCNDLKIYHLIARSPQLFTHTVFNWLFNRVQLFANTEAEHVLWSIDS